MIMFGDGHWALVTADASLTAYFEHNMTLNRRR